VSVVLRAHSVMFEALMSYLNNFFECLLLMEFSWWNNGVILSTKRIQTSASEGRIGTKELSVIRILLVLGL
jgi:hypothetical protein